jgi:hypothetical protein
MTDEQKSLANKIVEHFKNSNGDWLTVAQIDKAILNKTYSSQSPLIPILSILAYHDILLYEPTKYTSAGMVIENAHYILTNKGWSYESYDKLLQDLKHKQDLEIALIESSIASNKSVKYVNRLFWVTAAFAFFSSVGTVGTFILELRKEEQKPSQATSTSLPDTTKQNKPIPSVHDSLKKN